MKKLLLSALIFCFSFSQTAYAEVELVLSSWLPPSHPFVKNAMRPWAKEVGEVTDGRVKVRFLSKPLGTPPAHFDMARDGIADITYGLHSFTKDDRFIRSRIGQFSFLGDDAATASQAFWQVYSEQLKAQDEHQGVKLLSLFVHGPGIFNTREKKITALDDFKGLKIRTPGGYISELIADLGSVTLFMPSPEVYEKLSRGVIDGVTFSYEALTAFKLTKSLDYVMTVPGGLYNTTWFLVMNDEKWQQISPQDQAAIEAISGEIFAKQAGQAWNDADAKAKQKLAQAGIKVYPAPQDVLAQITEKSSLAEKAWAQAIGDNYDGLAALARYRRITSMENAAQEVSQ